MNLIGEVKNESKQQMVDLKEIFESNQKLKLSHAVLEEENRSLRAQMNFINEQYVHSSYLTSQEANQLHVAVEQPANHLPSSQQAVDTGQDPDKIGVDLIDSIIQLEHQLRQVTKTKKMVFPNTSQKLEN
ncbi:MAG: hypothetical protein HWD61_03025 [Parachlamydiaceae bacterium]|nr:MAG: hypothetical protein HWD61_03025 [Parachlamydiaceae bacterium]